jgi:hypothetical protein
MAQYERKLGASKLAVDDVQGRLSRCYSSTRPPSCPHLEPTASEQRPFGLGKLGPSALAIRAGTWNMTHRSCLTAPLVCRRGTWGSVSVIYAQRPGFIEPGTYRAGDGRLVHCHRHVAAG